MNYHFYRAPFGPFISIYRPLTAQEALLEAQLAEAMNLYNGSQAIIALYVALGGATK